MTAYELICFLAKNPDAPLAVIEGDSYEDKKRNLTAYVSADGEIVLQYWD